MKSNILLIIGLVVLLVGAIMSYCKIEPYADYVLIAGALVVIIRGAVHARERNENVKPTDDSASIEND